MQNPPESSRILIYQTEDKQTRLEVRLENETVWLMQSQIADLLQTTKQNVSLHIKNIFSEKELIEDSVVKESLTTAADGKSYPTQFYNLDVIISVGYRVKSLRGTQFRIWATQRLRDYIIKGFAMDDERLESGTNLGADYFDELLERIRDIRASERRFYQKITDIYAQCSIDYDLQAEITQMFYATVQNKLHWASHGHTAAEVIRERADASKLNMGLTTWKNAPKGRIRRTDVTVAKNYLDEKELGELNRIVTMYLDYAEDQARKRAPMTMTDWIKKLDGFLQFNERNILSHAGQVSHELATEHAETEFGKYEETIRQIEVQKPVSDFDRQVEKIKKLPLPKKKKKQ